LSKHRKNDVETFLLKDRSARLSDARIAQGEALLEGVIPHEHLSDDKITGSRTLLAGMIGIGLELDQLTADGLTALSALPNLQDESKLDHPVVSLLHGFAFGAKLWAAVGIGDPDAVKEIGRLMHALVMKLDSLPDGRTNLAPLLDDPDDMVCVCAGEYLIKLLPERVTELLRRINEKHDDSVACVRAGSVLFAWEHEKKT
jgi:hypothetical protein